VKSARGVHGGRADKTAAVFGGYANLTLWFALHVFFTRFQSRGLGSFNLSLPDIASLDWRAVVLSVLAAVLLFKLHFGVIRTIGAALICGLAFYFLGLR
jgi:chromate transporter